MGLANDGRGMNTKEQLRVLGQNLKQSRHKAFEVLMKESRQSGAYTENPEEVLRSAWERLMEFQEDMIEKQTRVRREWASLVKGNMSCVQFLPRFESIVSELVLVELGKPDRESYSSLTWRK